LNDAHAGFIRNENENVVEINEHQQSGGVDKNVCPALEFFFSRHSEKLLRFYGGEEKIPFIKN
jgi:hypothetical protein